MQPFHDRQPIILEPSEYDEWLAPAERPPLHLLRILPPEKLSIVPAAPRNSNGLFEE
jgi:putative SOS response-associated peptidase YedK